MSAEGHMGDGEQKVSTDGAARKYEQSRRLAVDEMPERLSDIIARLWEKWAVEMKK